MSSRGKKGGKSKIKPAQSLAIDGTTSLRFTDGYGLKKGSRFR